MCARGEAWLKKKKNWSEKCLGRFGGNEKVVSTFRDRRKGRKEACEKK